MSLRDETTRELVQGASLRHPTARQPAPAGQRILLVSKPSSDHAAPPEDATRVERSPPL